MRHNAEIVQQSHAAARKALRRRNAPGQRQLNDQIGPAGARGAGADMLVKDSRRPPLDKIARHDAHDRRVSARRSAALADMVEMALVEGIVFTHDSNDTHGITSCVFGILR